MLGKGVCVCVYWLSLLTTTHNVFPQEICFSFFLKAHIVPVWSKIVPSSNIQAHLWRRLKTHVDHHQYIYICRHYWQFLCRNRTRKPMYIKQVAGRRMPVRKDCWEMLKSGGQVFSVSIWGWKCSNSNCVFQSVSCMTWGMKSWLPVSFYANTF